MTTGVRSVGDIDKEHSVVLQKWQYKQESVHMVKLSAVILPQKNTH